MVCIINVGRAYAIFLMRSVRDSHSKQVFKRSLWHHPGTLSVNAAKLTTHSLQVSCSSLPCSQQAGSSYCFAYSALQIVLEDCLTCILSQAFLQFLTLATTATTPQIKVRGVKRAAHNQMPGFVTFASKLSYVPGTVASVIYARGSLCVLGIKTSLHPLLMLQRQGCYDLLIGLLLLLLHEFDGASL